MLGPSAPEALPPFLSAVHHVPFRTASRLAGAFREMLWGSPTFMLTRPVDPAAAERAPWKPYDLAWCGPVGVLGAADWFRRHGRPLARSLALGLNDVQTFMYLDAVKELLSGRYGFDPGRVAKLLRWLLIWRGERRYLADVDLVHLQTPREARRMRVVTTGMRRRPDVVIAPAGVKEELLALPGEATRSRKVLFMTHIGGGRLRESSWFLERVWPRIRSRAPEAELLLVGLPPDTKSWRGPPPGAEHLGWVEDLPGLFASVRVVVVPTLQSTGVLNRILDAMAAAVPVVTTPPALSTVAGATAGTHALCGDTAGQFADQVVSLLSDDDRYEAIRTRGRIFAGQWPSWSERGERILHATEREIERRASRGSLR